MNIFNRILLRQENDIRTEKQRVKSEKYIARLRTQRKVKSNKMIRLALINQGIISIAIIFPGKIKIAIILTSLSITLVRGWLAFNDIKSIDDLIHSEESGANGQG